MKGVEPGVMMSQMFAKTTGLSKGIATPALHSSVPGARIFGNTTCSGRTFRSRVSSRSTHKMERTDNVVVAYRQWRASNVGDFHEALNFAGVQKLPIIFICENNYTYSVPVEKSMAIDDAADRASGYYGSDGVAINGNDVLAVYQATWRVRARAPWGRTDADRVQDARLARALGARQGVLSNERRAGYVEEPGSDPDLHHASKGLHVLSGSAGEGHRADRVTKTRRTRRSWNLR